MNKKIDILKIENIIRDIQNQLACGIIDNNKYTPYFILILLEAKIKALGESI